MERFGADASEEWERQWFDAERAVGFQVDESDSQQDQSRHSSGYAQNNPVLARIDYRSKPLVSLVDFFVTTSHV